MVWEFYGMMSGVNETVECNHVNEGYHFQNVDVIDVESLLNFLFITYLPQHYRDKEIKDAFWIKYDAIEGVDPREKTSAVDNVIKRDILQDILQEGKWQVCMGFHTKTIEDCMDSPL